MTRPASLAELRTLTAHPTGSQTLGPGSPTPESMLPHAISEIIQARLALLAELEASLQASQRALLARDISGLEQQTSEQMRVHKALAILSPPASRLSDSGFPGSSSTLAAELRAAEMRVLQLGRIQLGLLARAQRWLRTVAHLLAGVEKSYGPPSGTASPASATASTSTRSIHPTAPESEDRQSCRA